MTHLSQFISSTKQVLFAGIFLLTALASVATQAARPATPNILVFLSDDHTQAAISAYGSKITTTPNIDKIAQNGVLFTKSFVGNSICSPSRATFLTGLHSCKNGVSDLQQALPNQQTLPKLLKAAGYQTGIVGKWHLLLNPTNPTTAGFEKWNVLGGGYEQGNYYTPDFHDQNGNHTAIRGAFVSDVINSNALDWLENRDLNKPFFLMVNHKATHQTWTPSPEQMTDTNTFYALEAQNLYEPPTLWDDYSTHSPISPARTNFIDHFSINVVAGGNGIRHNKEYGRMTAAQKLLYRTAYKTRWEKWDTNKNSWTWEQKHRFKYNCFIKDYIRAGDTIDQSVGEIVAYLEAHGLADNTIIIYSSDQGFFLGEHSYYEKRLMSEPPLSTPFLMQWKANTDIAPGSKVTNMIQNIDYAPTLLEAVGIDIPTNHPMQGLSFLPFMEGQQIPWRDAIYYHYSLGGSMPPHFGVRTRRYKLMYFYTKHVWEMYDLETDPTEVVDRYWEFNTNPHTHNIVISLKKRLKELRSQYGDTRGPANFPIEEPFPKVHGNIQPITSSTIDIEHENLLGAKYQLMKSPDLQTWTNAGEVVTGTGFTNYHHLMDMNESKEFYTVYRISPPPPSTAPTVSLTGPYSTESNYTVTVTFSEPVTGLTDSDFVVSNGTASTLSGSDALYSVEITPSGTDNISVMLPADSVTDLNDGLENEASQTLVTRYGAPSATTPVTNGLYLSLIADDLTLADGTTVSSWIDSTSGNVLTENHANVATYKLNNPNFAGHSTVTFNGSGGLTDTSLTAAPDTDHITLFVVARVLTINAATQRSLFWGQKNGNNRFRIAKNNKKTVWSARVGNGGGLPTNVQLDTQRHIFTLVSGKNGSNVDFLIDNTSVKTGSSGNGTPLGKALVGDKMNADIAEVLMYNRTLTDAEIADVNDYLSAKYSN